MGRYSVFHLFVAALTTARLRATRGRQWEKRRGRGRQAWGWGSPRRAARRLPWSDVFPRRLARRAAQRRDRQVKNGLADADLDRGNRRALIAEPRHGLVHEIEDKPVRTGRLRGLDLDVDRDGLVLRDGR